MALNALLATLLLPAVVSFQEAPRSKEWNQPRGNAAGTACIDVAPLAAPPTERWRIASEAVLAGPVVSKSRLFVVVRERGAAKLLVLDPETGRQVATAELAEVDAPLGLVAGDGLVALAQPSSILSWRLDGDALRAEPPIDGSFAGEPTLHGGTLFVPRGGGGVQAIDRAAGKAIALLPSGFGRAPGLDSDLVNGKPAPSLLCLAVDDKKGELKLARHSTALVAGKPKLGAPEAVFSGPKLATGDDSPQTTLIGVKGEEGIEWCAWFGGSRGCWMLRKRGAKVLRFELPPAASGSKLYGFDPEGRLLEFDNERDGDRTLAQSGNVPKGGQLGAASLARDVLFLGNWALEIGRRKVLWCLDSIEADGPAIPAGDQLLVIRTKQGELVGFGNGPAGSGAGSGAESSGRTTTAGARSSGPPMPPGPPGLPGAKPGIIRSDGVFVPGKAVTIEGGRWRVEPESGAPYELAPDEIAFLDDGTSVRRLGDERAAYQAFWRYLAAKHVEEMVPIFEEWRTAKMFEECERILEELRLHGLDAARADELAASIAGQSPVKGAAATKAKKSVGASEADSRDTSARRMVGAARWCGRNDAKVAASVLFARALETSPAAPPELDEALAWLPTDFPEEESEEATLRSWLRWADALLPSGAAFAELDDSTRRRISVTKFATDSIALSTKNLLMFSKEKDPAVLGPLLARGEATIRALEKILGASPMGLSSHQPLEVRIYKTRQDYLDDRIAGSLPPEWSGGCYSPGDGISRFYSQYTSEKEAALDHTLHEVFAHETTHQWVDRRWMRKKHTADSGSYWMVEGFAEFVGGQALEIGRLGDSFDDPTVESLDKTAAAEQHGQLLPVDYVLDLTQPRFHQELEGGFYGPVQLKHTLTETLLTKRGVFYDESAALTFFVLNRCQDGRAIYRRWLEQVYSGQSLVEPWKDLGFDEVWGLRDAFQGFLRGI